MASFNKGPNYRTPFGKNEFRRSTDGEKAESYTVAASTVPARTIDGHAGQKVLQPGTVMALITAGPEAGKVGPYQALDTNESVAIDHGMASSGDFTLTFDGETTAAIAWNATAAAVQAALEALDNIEVGDVIVTGGTVDDDDVVIEFIGQYANTDVPDVTVTDNTNDTVTVTVTDGGPDATPSESADGRSVVTNIVGINKTFLPWQLMERDVEIGVVYEGTVIQEWCIELDADGLETAMTNTTRDAIVAKKHLDIRFPRALT